MKHFSLGLASGAAAGVVVSLLRDKNGNRLGKQLREGVQATRKDADNLSNALHSLKDAGQELSDALPQAEKSLTELQKEIEYYEMSVSRLIDHLQEQATVL
ncbi:hypothetical protein EQ500_15275, partial [Lactobacillus sp. XV13L]|nr:hypothetical protein [Lactobacillus sp. XV13L]